MENRTFAVGATIRFAGEESAYTVRAIGQRYAVCTRPVNRRDVDEYPDEVTSHDIGKVWYTIVDSDRMLRGPHNMVFNEYDFVKDDGCRHCLADIESGKIELSRRRSKPVFLAS